MENIIYGRNPVLEALKAEHEIDKILLQQGIASAQKIIDIAKQNNITFQFVNKKKLDELTENANHQGIAAYVAAHTYSSVEDILKAAQDKDEPPFIVICENLTDPHNLGSILRTANGAGVHGVIIPKNRSVSLTSTVAKTSAGAVEYTRVAKVANIAQTIAKLKKSGLWIVGTDLSAQKTHYETDLKGSIAVVIGSEGEGMSRLVRESCDFLVKIPMRGEIQSLNASNACAVLLYEALRQRGFNSAT